MKTAPQVILIFVCWLAMALSLVGCRSQQAMSRHAPTIHPAEVRHGLHDQRVIVQLKSDVKLEPNGRSFGEATVISAKNTADGLRLVLSVREPVGEALAKIRRSPLVAYAEPDYVVRIKPPEAKASPLRFLTMPSKVKSAHELPGAIGFGGQAPSVVVAVIDTAFLISHKELVGNLWWNRSERSGIDGRDDDGNGYFDDIHGVDATVRGSHPLNGKPESGQNSRHGTAVMGIIGASGKAGTGVVGVASSVQLMPLRAIGEEIEQRGERITTGSIASIADCIDYALKHGAKVINASYGQSFFSQVEYDAIKRARDAGIIVVAATANDGRDNDICPEYPASYLLDNVVTVTAVDKSGGLLGNFGGGRVDIAALGADLESCGNRAEREVAGELNGTSFAAPQVSGALALLAEKFPGDHYRERINRLLRGVRKYPSAQGRLSSGGFLNVAGALAGQDTRPPNDDFDDAIHLSRVNHSGGATSAAYIAARGSNKCATVESGPPPANWPTGLKATVWWRWTAPKDGLFTFTTEGSAADAIAIVGCGNTWSGFQVLNPSRSDTKTRSAAYDVKANTEYRIAVGSQAATGGIALVIGQPAANDNQADRCRITLGQPVEGENRLATPEAGELGPSLSYAGRSVWYSWEVPETPHCSFSATISSNEFAAAVVVFQVLPGGALQKISSAVCFAGKQEHAKFVGRPGETVMLMVDSSDRGHGKFSLQLFQEL